MATRRIKDITNTATTFASDDFIALDGATQGTRKMDKDDLIAEVSAGVSGDYLEEANNLSDVASLDTSKLNMEIPDVGTAPNEVPLNGMLGDMAYQSSDGVSAAKLEVETLEVTGTVPDSLTIEHDTNPTLYLERAGIPNGYIKSVDANGTETSGIQLYGSEVRLRTGASTRWTIDASGNLVAAAASDIVMPDNAVAALEIKEGGNVYFRFVTTNGAEKIEAYKPITASSGIVMGGSSGIDFGSVAGGTGTPTPTTGGLLDDYETGTWSGTYTPQTGSFTTMTMDTDLVYTKVGNLVHVSGFIRTDDVDITGGSNGLKITGLPFTCAKPSAISIGFAWNWGTGAPLAGYIFGSEIWLQTRTGTTARTDGFNVSNMSTGTLADRNALYLEATYQAS
jgi:hypothetical protein